MSLHRYDHSHFFPGSPEAEYDHIGSGDGLGYNVNVAWNDVSVCVYMQHVTALTWYSVHVSCSQVSMGDGDYLSAFHQVILPIAREFNPQLVLVSCGFDSGRGDPLASFSFHFHLYLQLPVLAHSPGMLQGHP